MQLKNHKIGWIVGALVVACGFSAVRGLQGGAGPFEIFQQIREMQKQNRDLEIQIGEKQERLRRFSEGRSESELEVKRRLKYLNPGERQMVLPEGVTTPPAAVPASQQQQQQPAAEQ
ncbi:MAG: hypothetical protein JST65_09350 [Acidobacteria bacterium]|nr:hypothetical protein [Acidobacteriota bacterium]